jgi:DNA-binding CsgD family transcriptional regulator
LHEQQLGTAEDAEFLRHCRAIREYVDQRVSAPFSTYVAAVLVGVNGRILDIDERSAEYLLSSCVLGIRHNRLFAQEKDVNDHLVQAIGRVSAGGKSDTLICSAGKNSAARYAILLQPNPRNSSAMPSGTHPVVCFIFPLGRRRVASAQQLISLFGLSPAEARLARALCHGETLEEYAEAQNVKLPTVKTQLRAVFTKTQTDRQVALVNLIAGIPPLR